MSYKDNIKKLETLLVKLEDKNLGIEEGIKLYEEGLAQVKTALTELETQKGRVTILKKELARLTETPFTDENDEETFS